MVNSPWRSTEEQNRPEEASNSIFIHYLVHAGRSVKAQRKPLRDAGSSAVTLSPPHAPFNHGRNPKDPGLDAKPRFCRQAAGKNHARQPASPAKKGIVPRGPVSPADRFIPPRQFSNPPSNPFHVTKVPRQLTPAERLRRRCPSDVDPFMPSRPRRSGGVSRTQMQAIEVAHIGPHLINGQMVTASRGHNGPIDPPRQVSAGAVWNVGGASAAVLGGPYAQVSGAYDGVLGSGVTAPMYVPKFMMKELSVTDDRDQHESRVALALNIDRAARLLGTCAPSSALHSARWSSCRNYERPCPFPWRDTAWKKDERTPGKFKPVLFLVVMNVVLSACFFLFCYYIIIILIYINV